MINGDVIIMMGTEKEEVYKFVGGLRLGLMIRTWPNAELEISNEALVLRDKMFNKGYKFSEDNIIKITLKKSFLFLGCGIQIHLVMKRLSFGMMVFDLREY